MNRIAMKTISYLPDHPFKFGFVEQEDITKERTYDDFQMTATVMDFSGENVVWVGLDIGGISTAIYDVFAEEIGKVIDVKPTNLYISGTHTHSGPNFSKNRTWGEESRADMDEICFTTAKKAAEMVKECMGRLEPFTAEIKVTGIEGCYSNRNSLDGPCDKNVTLIRFKNAETGKPIGMWFNMACHSTMIYPRNLKMSTDIVGNVNKRLAAHYGIPVLSTAGCQGDTSTRLTRQRLGYPDTEEHDLADLDRIVSGIVDQVLAQPEDFEPINIDRFQVTCYEVGFHYTLDPEVTERKIANLEAEIAAETNADQARIKTSALRGVKSRRGQSDFKGVLKCRAINMGEVKIGVFPGELVASLGLQVVRHESHDHRLVACYTNDRGCGYLVEVAEYGKNFESLSSIVPVGTPEVITTMMVKELDQFDLLK